MFVPLLESVHLARQSTLLLGRGCPELAVLGHHSHSDLAFGMRDF
jgi:hypothetical protein